MSFTRNTGLAIKTEIAFTERIKNVYAARGACIYATKMLLLPNRQEKESGSGNIKNNFNKQKRNKKKNKTIGPWTPGNNTYPIKIGDRDCEVLISDESGKININKITDETKVNFNKFLTSLKIEELTSEIVTDSILDWIDADDLHHANGAEKDYYSALPEPYEPNNAPFESIEELILVKGVTPEIFELLRKRLTIYGTDKININFATHETLMYVPKMTKEIAAAIIKLRGKRGKIKQLDKLKDIFAHFGILGSDFQDILKYITIYDSNYLTIKSISYSDKIQSSYTFVVRKGGDNCRILATYAE